MQPLEKDALSPIPPQPKKPEAKTFLIVLAAIVVVGLAIVALIL